MADSADKIHTYRQMLKLDRRSRVFALLAEELCAAGQYEEAAEVCKKGLLFHPNHLRSRVLLGCALMEMGEADQSEGILAGVVEEIRKNSIVFKLLSEFATFSGNAQSAVEYARIYEALQTSGPAPAGMGAPLELDRTESAFVPEKEASELDGLEAAAIEVDELNVADAETAVPEISPPPAPVEDAETAAPEISPPPTPETVVDNSKYRAGLEYVLANLAERIEERDIMVPSAVLTEDDRKMLKKKIVEALGG